MTARTLFAGLVLLVGGCIEGLEVRQARLVDTLQRQEQRLEALTKEVGELRTAVNDGLTLALCTPELRQLLENVQKECSQLASLAAPVRPLLASTQLQSVAAPGPVAAGTCSTKQIRPAVIAADPERRGRFLKLMAHVPHEVVYLSQGSTEGAPHRVARLHRLARRALLSNTVFLVVSSPEASGRGGAEAEAEAERRAAIVEALLLEQHIPPAKIHRWVYAFPASRAEIDRGVDLPGLADPKELNRGVWVFRADC